MEHNHDKGYKRILSKKENFLDLIKNFVNEAWVTRIDPENLQLIDKEFILQDFSNKEADIVYKCKVEGEEIIFYILLELQSTVDYSMPFRLLMYITELMKREFLDTDHNTRRRKGFKLPTVVPIVLYNGAKKWTVAREFIKYQNGSEIFNEYKINFNYILLSVNEYNESELLEISSLMSSVFTLDAHNNINDFLRKLKSARKIYSRLKDDAQVILVDWLKEILKSKFEEQNVERILKDFEKGDANNMTYAIERMIDKVEKKGRKIGYEEGREEGIEKGREEGIEKGIEKGISRVIYRMYNNKRSLEEIQQLTGEDIDKIKKIIASSTEE